MSLDRQTERALEHTTIGGEPSAVGERLTSEDHHREIASMIRRLQDEHADVPVAVIADLVYRHFAALGEAKVQTFRAILTERAVRRHLRDAEATCRDDRLAPSAPDGMRIRGSSEWRRLAPWPSP